MTARSEHGGGQDALDRELASCEGDHPEYKPALDEDELRARALRNLQAGLGVTPGDAA